MREESVARRYATALFLQAKRENVLDQTSAGLAKAVAYIEATPSLAALLNQPLVTASRKKAALKTAFEKDVNALTLRVLSLLIDKHRVETIPAVLEGFQRAVRDDKNIAAATAVTAIPLTPAQLAALEKSLEKRTGKDIELTTEIDPSIIGGILVRLGDTVLDGTVRGKMDRLREALLVRR